MEERPAYVDPILASIPPTGKEIFDALSINDEPPRAVGRTALSLLDEAAATARPFTLDKDCTGDDRERCRAYGSGWAMACRNRRASTG